MRYLKSVLLRQDKFWSLNIGGLLQPPQMFLLFSDIRLNRVKYVPKYIPWEFDLTSKPPTVKKSHVVLNLIQRYS